jgi:hypothetical protein
LSWLQGIPAFRCHHPNGWRMSFSFSLHESTGACLSRFSFMGLGIPAFRHSVVSIQTQCSLLGKMFAF